MSNQGYYRFTMHEYGADTYHCHGKYYFCTLDELYEFGKQAWELPGQDPIYEDEAAHLKWLYWKIYCQEWDDEVEGECPLVPVKLLHESRAFYLGDKLDGSYLMCWRDLCPWRWEKRFDCDIVTRTCCWFQYGDKYYRASKARYVCLRENGEPAKWKQDRDMFWGFPKVIVEEAPIYEHLLMVAEDEFDTFWEAQADWVAFERCPAHPFNIYLPEFLLPG